MSVAVEFTRAAQREFDAACDWYDSQITGLGTQFALAVQEIMLEIAENPKRWAEAVPGVREAQPRRWPYSIMYQIFEDHVRIIAVHHASRDPSSWMGRIPK